MTLKLFFEVSDSDVYGGLGTKGYPIASLNVNEEVFEHLDKAITYEQEMTARALGVSVDKVQLISEEEYDLMTENEPCRTRSFPELFHYLKEKEMNTGVLEAYYRLYQKLVAGTEDCNEQECLEKKNRYRSYMCSAVDYLSDFGIISMEDSLVLQQQI